MEVLMISVH